MQIRKIEANITMISSFINELSERYRNFNWGLTSKSFKVYAFSTFSLTLYMRSILISRSEWRFLMNANKIDYVSLEHSLRFIENQHLKDLNTVSRDIWIINHKFHSNYSRYNFQEQASSKFIYAFTVDNDRVDDECEDIDRGLTRTVKTSSHKSSGK